MAYTLDGWRNKNGTCDRCCKCGTWKQHWINFNSLKLSWPTQCSIDGCSNNAEVGGHIYNSIDRQEYIIPMCRECNNRKDSFALKYGTSLASANKEKTCEN